MTSDTAGCSGGVSSHDAISGFEAPVASGSGAGVACASIICEGAGARVAAAAMIEIGPIDSGTNELAAGEGRADVLGVLAVSSAAGSVVHDGAIVEVEAAVACLAIATGIEGPVLVATGIAATGTVAIGAGTTGSPATGSGRSGATTGPAKPAAVARL